MRQATARTPRMSPTRTGVEDKGDLASAIPMDEELDGASCVTDSA